ncbi:MAG: hypothetical protein HQ519_00155 [Planctomycetes bacterium]|nr:hypothetical protein [Planctomycetota bacterium]
MTCTAFACDKHPKTKHSAFASSCWRCDVTEFRRLAKVASAKVRFYTLEERRPMEGQYALLALDGLPNAVPARRMNGAWQLSGYEGQLSNVVLGWAKMPMIPDVIVDGER